MSKQATVRRWRAGPWAREATHLYQYGSTSTADKSKNPAHRSLLHLLRNSSHRIEPKNKSLTRWVHLCWDHQLVTVACHGPCARGRACQNEMAGGGGRCKRGAGPGSLAPPYPLWQREMTLLPSKKRTKAHRRGPRHLILSKFFLYATSLPLACLPSDFLFLPLLSLSLSSLLFASLSCSSLPLSKKGFWSLSRSSWVSVADPSSPGALRRRRAGDRSGGSEEPPRSLCLRWVILPLPWRGIFYVGSTSSLGFAGSNPNVWFSKYVSFCYRPLYRSPFLFPVIPMQLRFYVCLCFRLGWCWFMVLEMAVCIFFLRYILFCFVVYLYLFSV